VQSPMRIRSVLSIGRDFLLWRLTMTSCCLSKIFSATIDLATPCLSKRSSKQSKVNNGYNISFMSGISHEIYLNARFPKNLIILVTSVICRITGSLVAPDAGNPRVRCEGHVYATAPSSDPRSKFFLRSRKTIFSKTFPKSAPVLVITERRRSVSIE